MLSINNAPPALVKQLLEKHPHLKKDIDIEFKKATVFRSSLPCVYTGEEAGPKGWHYCDHPNLENNSKIPDGDIVCSCKGCGPVCPGYTPFRKTLTSNLKRNLLFHMHPVPKRWKWHTDKLNTRKSLFNGRKIIAVNTGINLDSPELIQKELPDFEIIAVPGDSNLREVATFEPLFKSLSPAENEITLYAQSKSVTRSPLSTCRRWTEILYETLCDYYPYVEEVLNQYPIAGSFKKIGRGWRECTSDWHYSGSWFWFRNKELLGKANWNTIDRFWGGIEPYPSRHFSAEEAGCIFHSGIVPDLNCYSWSYITNVVEPELTKFHEKHENQKTIYD